MWTAPSDCLMQGFTPEGAIVIPYTPQRGKHQVFMRLCTLTAVGDCVMRDLVPKSRIRQSPTAVNVQSVINKHNNTGAVAFHLL